jgi:hypothetical protein
MVPHASTRESALEERKSRGALSRARACQRGSPPSRGGGARTRRHGPARVHASATLEERARARVVMVPRECTRALLSRRGREQASSRSRKFALERRRRERSPLGPTHVHARVPPSRGGGASAARSQDPARVHKERRREHTSSSSRTSARERHPRGEEAQAGLVSPPPARLSSRGGGATARRHRPARVHAGFRPQRGTHTHARTCHRPAALFIRLTVLLTLKGP